MLGYFLQGVTLGFSAAVSPGPFQAYLLAQATAHGWRRTLSAAFAPLLSDGPIILIVLFILAQVPDSLLRALNIAGGLFLFYLAYGAFRTFLTYTGAGTDPSTSGSILRATMVNALAPGPWLFWSILAGPILVEAWEQSPAWGVAFLFGFYLLLVGGNIVFITLFAATRRLGPQVTRLLNGIAALGLLALGLYQLGRGILNL